MPDRREKIITPDDWHPQPKAARIVITEAEVSERANQAPALGSMVTPLLPPKVTPAAEPGSDSYPVVSELDGKELPTYRHYKPVRRLGQGGMGMVFLARDTVLHRDVAVKVPLGNCGPNSPTRKRFQREAEIAAVFRHPNFCPIYDLGDILGRPCLVMAYLEGETLAARLKKEGPLTDAAPPRLYRRWLGPWPPRTTSQSTIVT